MRKVKNIAIKEFRHILRDPRSLIIAILMPMLMTFLYGYAINLDIKNIKLAILDFDKTLDSRLLSEKFYNTTYFTYSQSDPKIMDPEEILKKTHAAAVLTIPDGFASSLENNRDFELGLLIDGADANTAAAVASYSEILVNRFFMEKLPPEFEIPGVQLSSQVLYNPDLKSSHFFVPGLIAVILMMISALLTSITIAREKETGTMEQLLTTPVTPRQIIIGKVIPYIGLALLDAVLVLLFAVFYFGVPFVGSILLLLVFGLIYIITALSIGLLISTLVKTQQLAMMAALMVTVMPSVLLSGFIFEIRNMPEVLQYITHIVPARYFMAIIRGVLLKGAGLTALWIEAASMIILSAVLLIIATFKFNLKIG